MMPGVQQARLLWETPTRVTLDKMSLTSRPPPLRGAAFCTTPRLNMLVSFMIQSNLGHGALPLRVIQSWRGRLLWLLQFSRLVMLHQ